MTASSGWSFATLLFAFAKAHQSNNRRSPRHRYVTRAVFLGRLANFTYNELWGDQPVRRGQSRSHEIAKHVQTLVFGKRQ
jgi:hypothetical protein